MIGPRMKIEGWHELQERHWQVEVFARYDEFWFQHYDLFILLRYHRHGLIDWSAQDPRIRPLSEPELGDWQLQAEGNYLAIQSKLAEFFEIYFSNIEH